MSLSNKLHSRKLGDSEGEIVPQVIQQPAVVKLVDSNIQLPVNTNEAILKIKNEGKPGPDLLRIIADQLKFKSFPLMIPRTLVRGNMLNPVFLYTNCSGMLIRDQSIK